MSVDVGCVAPFEECELVGLGGNDRMEGSVVQRGAGRVVRFYHLDTAERE